MGCTVRVIAAAQYISPHGRIKYSCIALACDTDPCRLPTGGTAYFRQAVMAPQKNPGVAFPPCNRPGGRFCEPSSPTDLRRIRGSVVRKQILSRVRVFYEFTQKICL